MQNGWIKIYRKIEKNRYYLLEPFTKGQAWIDLILIANHKDGEMCIRGNIIKVPRGCVGWANETIAKRWKWSRGKFNRFMKQLSSDGQIEQQKTPAITLIRVINYDEYQEIEQQTEQQKDDRQYRNKNVKNEKNIPDSSNDSSDCEFLPSLPSAKKKREKKDPARSAAVFEVIAAYREQYQYVTGKAPIVSKADYVSLYRTIDKLPKEQMIAMIGWYVRMENFKFKQHPSLCSIYTVENVNKFNLEH